MKKWLLLLFLPLQVIAAPFSALTPVYSASLNINIQRGNNPQGDVVFAYWEQYGLYGQIIHYCSITFVEDFLKNIEARKNLLDALSTTPGVKWGWTTIAPLNINTWCIQ